MFETERRDGVVQFTREATDWLSTGWRGGRRVADRAFSLTVPEGWRPDDVEAAVDEQVTATGFDRDADDPVLLTGVHAANARGARCGPVEAYATVGLSNPAALPMDPPGGTLPDGELVAGTVNVLVGTTAGLSESALANLVAVAAEAKAATLNIFGDELRPVDYSAMPFAVFSSPEVAGVGETEAAVRADDREYATNVYRVRRHRTR